MPTFQELILHAKKTQREIAPEEVARIVAAGEKLMLVDVRESEEYRSGSIPGAIHVPRGFLEVKIEAAVPDPNSILVLFCAGGTRSILAAETLSRMGYTNVLSMAGGFTKWVDEGRPVEKPAVLSEAQRRRYARHLAMQEVGEAGQAKLLASKVLLIGAGGLGSPVAYYLTAAGVGALGMVDFDVVDETNLQRQILHSSARIGMSKVESARQTLLAFNPALKFVPFEEKLTGENVERIVEGFDIVVDGSDNFPTRYLINDACVHLKKPLVHGSVFRFEGQVTVFDPQKGGPCYRCLYPEPPPPGLAPSCAQAGVLGVLPGIVGLLQATETLKHVLGIGRSLLGRLLVYDALGETFREFKIPKDPECAYCGQGKPFPGYVDYDFFCSTRR